MKSGRTGMSGGMSTNEWQRLAAELAAAAPTPARDGRIRVFVCDDAESFRELVKASLAADASVTVVGEAADGIAGINGISSLQPDVALIDIRMPGLDGFAV